MAEQHLVVAGDGPGRPGSSSSRPVLALRDVSKSFGPTKAVRGVTLEVRAGEVLALVGENGAGKSTLGRIVGGVHRPSSGTVEIDGEERVLRSPREGLAAGVSFMAQEIALVPGASVEDNVLLGRMPRRGIFPDRAATRERYLEVSRLTGFELAPDAQVGRLRVADQQKVEIMRAVAQDARVIVMDEPSATLTADEADRLHATIRALTARGTAVLLISHFLEEVLDLADSIAVMRDGELVQHGPTTGQTVGSLVSAMVGRELETEYAERPTPTLGPVRLSVRGLSRRGALDGIDLDVRAGEILGLAGLVGAGRTEIARAIFGADRVDGGTVVVDDEVCRPRHPQQALDRGICMIPESRKDDGLVLGGSIRHNLLLPVIDRFSTRGLVHGRSMRRRAVELADALDLRFGDIDQPVGDLSGGNQQKVLLGRALEVDPAVLIVDEPTRGVDIAAKRAIHALLEDMAAEGKAILFISSEIEEVLGVCHRVLVVHRGRIHGEFLPPFDKKAVVGAFFGQSGELT